MSVTDHILDMMSQSSGCVLDSNLLLLWCVGSYDEEWITKFKRTNSYAPEEYALLRRFLAHFTQVLTTPHILTEVSNLSKQLPSNVRKEYFPRFAEQIGLLKEKTRPAQSVCGTGSFRKFGLTDSVIVEIATNGYLVLTDDLPLYGSLHKLGLAALNFNHIRSLAW